MTDSPLPLAGRRIHGSFGDMAPGDYGIGPNGQWWLMSPNGCRGTIDLSKHAVTEHDNGTITVGPSLVFVSEYGNFDPECCEECRERAHNYGVLNFPNDGWHGWLERGLWRSA